MDMDKVSKVHTTVCSTNDGWATVTYHYTPVVRFNNEKIVLNTGGWKTVTTKARMNQASNQFDLGYQVYQRDYEWFVSYKGVDVPMGRTIELSR